MNLWKSSLVASEAHAIFLGITPTASDYGATSLSSFDRSLVALPVSASPHMTSVTQVRALLRYSRSPVPLTCSGVPPPPKHPRDVQREMPRFFRIFLELRQPPPPESFPLLQFSSSEPNVIVNDHYKVRGCLLFGFTTESLKRARRRSAVATRNQAPSDWSAP